MIAAGLILFFGGWLIYGVLLQDFMTANYDQTGMRSMDDFIWWAFIVANLLSGYLITFVIKLKKVTGLVNAVIRSFSLGILVGGSLDLSIYSMELQFINFKAVVVDIIFYSLLFAVAGIVSWFILREKEKVE